MSSDVTSNAPDDVEEVEEAGAADGMSTVPRQAEDPYSASGGDGAEPVLPSLGVLGWGRWFWRQLTSMRTALLLLLLLSLAAIPGSLIPQRPVDPIRVADYFRNHPTKAKIYDKLDLFNVFSSWWFAAIYLLLFVSLAGCIVPRVWAHGKAMRAKPPAAPRNLARMPAYARWETDASPEEVVAAARGALRGKRFRISPDTDGTSLAAEKGYARETGNLIFHIALFGVLIAVALGSLYNGKGTKIAVAGGGGFSNTLTQYDDFESGPLFDTSKMAPFGFKLITLDQSFQDSGTQMGAPRSYNAHIEYWEGTNGAHKTGDIQVNHPLQIGGTKVYLTATGYAPDVTVTDAKGNVAFSGPTVFLPRDSNRTSAGAIKIPDVTTGLEQLGFDGLFLPTGNIQSDGTLVGSQFPHSLFSGLDNPELVLTAYHGDLGLDSGVPQNVYQLDTTGMKQFMQANGKDPVKFVLAPGSSMTLPDGSKITFNKVDAWANFQINSEPGKQLILFSIAAAILGLIGSLFIRRRRVWVRAVTAENGGRTVVEVAGLTKTEGGGLRDEVQGFVDALVVTAPPVAVPTDTDTRTSPPEETDDNSSQPGEGK